MSNEIQNKNSELMPVNDFTRFEAFLENLGLPVENVIASSAERHRMMKALPEFLESLDPQIKSDARYLSKFVAGSAVGLFDAALNYVWNEVILNIRKIIEIYGLDIFYDAALGESIRENYKSKEDLKGIKDKVLLDTCRKLELLDDVVYKKLSHTLSMRNDIGASHPNSYSINTYELLGWLQTCIDKVINVKPSTAAITIKSIIDNLKKSKILFDAEVIHGFEKSIADISSSMTGNLLVTIFGLYTAENRDKIVRENIIEIAPIIWDNCLDDKKYDLGEKIDVFKANLDTKRLKLAESFFELCNGNRYMSLNTRTIKISSLCDALSEANQGWDNYYHEPIYAKQIMGFIMKIDDIPEERSEKVIKIFLECRIGKNVSYCNGVSPRGRVLYDSFLRC